jgi:AcrR family transcriptional regulator
MIHAAGRVFAQHGFRGASLSDIAAVLGKPKSALGYHFTSKTSLAVAVLESQNLVWMGMIAEAEALPVGIRRIFAPLYAIARNIQDSDLARGALRLVIDRASLDVPLPAASFSWRTVTIEAIEGAQRTGEIPDGVDVPGLAEMLINAGLGTVNTELVVTGDASVETRLAELWIPLLVGVGVDTWVAERIR